MNFNGFSLEAIAFLKELSQNNNRQWFQKNKTIYKKYLEPAGIAFNSAIQERLSDLFGDEFNGKIFRIYRDIRFSKDKTPYNPHIRMLFYPANTAGCSENPCFYFSLETDRVITGAGIHQFSKLFLERFRQAVVDDKAGNELEKLLNRYREKKGYYQDVPQLKRIPPGYDKSFPRAQLLKQKGLVVWNRQSLDEVISTPAFVDVISKKFISIRPVFDWLITNVFH